MSKKLIKTSKVKKLSKRDQQRKELLKVFKDSDSKREEKLLKKNLKTWTPFIKNFRSWDRSYLYPILWFMFDQLAEGIENSSLVNGSKYAKELEHARELCYKLSMFEKSKPPLDSEFENETKLLTELFEYIIENRGKWWW